MKPYLLTNLILLINLLYISHSSSFLSTNNEIQMVIDIIKSYDKPASVIAKLCWPLANKLEMTQMLNINSILVQFVNKETNRDDLTPKADMFYMYDLNCKDNDTFLRQASSAKKFSKSYKWIMLGTSKDGNIGPELSDLNILVDSEVIYSEQRADADFTMKMIYKIKKNGQWYTEFFGIWSKSFGLIKSPDMDVSISFRRRDLRRETIVSSVIISDNRTKTDLEDNKNILVDTLSKSTFRHIIPLYDFINATKALIYTNIWGYYANGSWNGMLGDLAHGDAELGGCVAFITNQRLDIVEYLSHPMPISAKFVFREPPLSYQNNLYLLPFKASVWYCTGGSVVILIIVLYINARWEKKKAVEFGKKTIDATSLPPRVSDITIFVLSAISQQGSSKEMKGTLGRVVMFIIFLMFLFLYTSYAACIVALLQSSSSQIRTLTDLLNSKLELGVEDVVYNRHYFSTATEHVRKAIYETKVAPKGSIPNYMGIEEGVRKLQKEPFAFNMNTGMGYRIVEKYFHEHEKCGLKEIPYIQHSNPWLCSRKDSPFREIYKIGFFRIQEHGLSDRQNRLIYAKKPSCAVGGGSFGSVDIIDFYPVLLMLLYGILLSILVLILEILTRGRRLPDNCI